MAEPTGENILKVLSGNQFGAEVTLSDGTYSFGSGPEADIQIDDVALQPIHGHVRLRGGKIELRAAQGDLNTASGLSVARDNDSWHEIAQMDAVSAGLSKFVIAGPGADWSSLSAATPQKPGPRQTTAGLASAVASVPRRALYATGAVVAVVGLVAFIASGDGGGAQREAQDGTAQAIAALRGKVDAMPFADQVQVIERADGTLAIEGYVEEQVERRAIQNTLDESGLPATVRVYVRENLRADVQGTIDSMQLPAQFTLDDAGNLVLTGTILDPAAAQKLVENVQTGIFGLASVESDIRTADQILSDLRTIADEAGLADLVVFRLDGLVVEATGIIPRERMDSWVGLMGVYSRRFADEIPLRSFVTLDIPANEDTAPVIIGSGPLAEAETGRMVSPETLSEPNEVDAQSLFAGQPDASAAPAGEATAQPRSALADALDRLLSARPDLSERLIADVESGRTPDTALLQEILETIGGRLEATDQNEVQVTVEGLGPLGTLDDLAANLRTLLSQQRAADTADAATPAAPVAAAPVAFAPIPQELLVVTATPEPASTGEEASPAADTGSTSSAPTPPEPSAVPMAAQPDPAPAPVATSTDPAPANTQSVTVANQPQPAPTALPLFALPESELLSLRPIIDEADRIIANEDNAAGKPDAVSPNLRALVAMQHEQLQFGKSLVRLPQPLTALPYPVDEAVACWDGALLTPELLPTALLVLDALSVSSTSDISGLSPDLRDVIMETALSPGRVRSCLARTETTFGDMVAGSSTFLAETARNPDFVEFVFRNVPKGELPLAGANLLDRRYIELTDGRKLGEGAAPDIASRIISIGDLGLLLRTAEGPRVQLYGNALGWRVADGCLPEECGVN